MSVFSEMNMSLVEMNEAMPEMTMQMIMPQLIEEIESDGRTISLCMAILNGGHSFLKLKRGRERRARMEEVTP